MTTATETTFLRPGIDYDAFAQHLAAVLAADAATRPIARLPSIEDLDRWLELTNWSIDNGRPLPRSVAAIIHLEDLGYTVDLESGDVERDPDWAEQYSEVVA